MSTLFHEIRHAYRALRRRPLAAVLAVAALALGIGANAALFSAVDAVLLRPFPFSDPDRLFVIWETDPQRGMERAEVSYPNFDDWRKQAKSFELMAAMPNAVSEQFVLTGAAEPTRFRAVSVSASFFDLLGTKPVLGRGLREEDDRPEAPRVVVLSHGLWQRQFGGASDARGRVITLDGIPFTIVGVMPPAFAYPKGAELWTPIVPSQPQYVADRKVGWLQVVGRLRPGVDREQARAELDGIVRQLAAEYQPESEGRGAVLTPITEEILGSTRPALLVLLGAVAVVLLIACANVATLLLAQAAQRRRETAVRLALGASRGRILRERLLETLLLSLAGAAAGLILAAWGTGVLVALAPGEIPRLDTIRIDGRVLAFTTGLSVVVALLAGLLPALAAARETSSVFLREGTRGTDTFHDRSWRRSLVAAEVALALVVLAGAALLVQSFLRLQRVPLGYETRGTLTMGLWPPAWKYPKPEDQRRFFRDVLERVRPLPGVEAAGAVLLRPLELGPIGVNAWILKEGEPAEKIPTSPATNYLSVTPGYFRAMGIPLKAGRDFDDRDVAGAPSVAVVGETLARRMWPGEDAIGKRMATHGTPKDGEGRFLWTTVVGVVADGRYRELNDVRLDLYVPSEQSPFPAQFLIVRSATDPGSLAAAIRREVQSVDGDTAVTGVATLGSIVSDALGGPRFRSVLIAGFALLALVLSALGIWGVVAWSVAQRTQEIGVRMALGARAEDVVRHVVARGMVPAFVGVAIGLLLAFASSRAVAGLLFGIGSSDPVTYAAVALVLLGVAFVASFAPARRAARLDPVKTLRQE
jgi:putative ABC transport system permease protein